MAARTVITALPAEEGHIAFDCQFYDETGETVTPDTVQWTLTDTNGRVITTQTGITPATTITILITGEQLALPDPLLIKRHCLVEWTFTSTLGAGIPDKNQIEFNIQELTAVT